MLRRAGALGVRPGLLWAGLRPVPGRRPLLPQPVLVLVRACECLYVRGCGRADAGWAVRV
jgi:hypothetical protein